MYNSHFILTTLQSRNFTYLYYTDGIIETQNLIDTQNNSIPTVVCILLHRVCEFVVLFGKEDCRCVKN
jgi:hypothetical protein